MTKHVKNETNSERRRADIALVLSIVGTFIATVSLIDSGRARRNAQGNERANKTLKVGEQLDLAWDQLGGGTGSEMIIRQPSFTETNLELARRHIQKALILDESSPRAKRILAYYYDSRGLNHKAEKAYETAIVADPESPHAYSNYAAFLTEQKQSLRAESLIRKAIALDPDFAGAWNNLGVLLVKQGRLKQAEECFRSAIRRDPRCLMAQDNLSSLSVIRSEIVDAKNAGDNLYVGMSGSTLSSVNAALAFPCGEVLNVAN